MQLVHITSGDFSAISLRQSLKPTNDQLLAFADCLDGGPITDFNSLEQWTVKRSPYLINLGFPMEHFVPLYVRSFPGGEEADIRLLQQADEIILWVATGFKEQILIPWLVKLFTNYHIALKKLKLIEAYSIKGRRSANRQVLGIGELTSHQLSGIYKRQEKRCLADEDIQELACVWAAITDSTPEKLVEYCARGGNSVRFPYLHEGIMLDFLKRYPDKRSGLNHHEKLLLRFCTERGPKAAHIISHAMAAAPLVGDVHLFWELRRLGNSSLPFPAINLKGDLKNIRDVEAVLTEQGTKFLSGESNFVECNGIDYWVGGVHLTSSNRWYWENNTIVAYNRG